MSWRPLLALIVCLGASALPVTAQEPTETTAGPIAHAVTREAVRLADAGELTSSSGETVQQGDKPGAEFNRSRRRKLAPGTEIIVAVRRTGW